MGPTENDDNMNIPCVEVVKCINCVYLINICVHICLGICTLHSYNYNESTDIPFCIIRTTDMQ